MRRVLVTLTALAASACEPCAAQTLQLDRWKAAKVEPRRAKEVEVIGRRIMANWGRYQKVSSTSRVPAHVIAGLHNMEASGSFAKHLHEGSPLTARTRWVPKGRPKTGSPPFTWEVSAADALAYDRMAAVNWKSLDASLHACERYNGTGYLRFHPSVPTPYLWAGTTIERPGKYVADGKWSSTARSAQIGVATIWKYLQSKNHITLPK